MAADDDPVGDGEGFQQATGDERGSNDAHAFLGVICAVAEAEKRRGEQLQAAEPAIHFLRTLTADDPAGEDG